MICSCLIIPDTGIPVNNDYLVAKRRKALRRAALRLGKTVWLFCRIVHRANDPLAHLLPNVSFGGENICFRPATIIITGAVNKAFIIYLQIVVNLFTNPRPGGRMMNMQGQKGHGAARTERGRT